MRKLKEMDEDEQLDWASKVLEKIGDRHAVALELQGWKIVNKHEPDRLWPFGGDIEAQCPLWCEDMRGPVGLKN